MRHIVLAILLILVWNQPLSAKKLSKEEKKKKQEAQKLFEQGVEHANKKEFDKAQASFMKAVKMDAEHVASYENLALLFLIKQKRLPRQSLKRRNHLR